MAVFDATRKKHKEMPNSVTHKLQNTSFAAEGNRSGTNFGGSRTESRVSDPDEGGKWEKVRRAALRAGGVDVQLRVCVRANLCIDDITIHVGSGGRRGQHDASFRAKEEKGKSCLR
uniref:Uncharacterized protein n=1 Tax=Eutreptiella gymnastica TaxID=73025 RepID=A0A7S4LGQ4_9EUGL|mmetsp:Transcript_73153/g.122531  ORF Transcript_73153/g.122531 Transcript_73153/m.122531 type:complete len:116 (+) Transcript_73153:218-565(+)